MYFFFTIISAIQGLSTTKGRNSLNDDVVRACLLTHVLPYSVASLTNDALYIPLEMKRVKRNPKKIVVDSACDAALRSLLRNCR